MDRSPEKSALLSTKVHSLEAKTGSTRQQFAHEAATTNAIFRPPKVFPSQSTQENSSKAASYSSTDAGLGRNSDQFISPLQAQYCSPTVPTAALGMSLPYGMIAGPGMDTRALNAGNLFYTYGSPVMSFPNYAAAGYGQSQRVKNSEETTTSDKANAVSTQLRPTEQPSRSSKEPMRTESVIKTVTDKQEIARKLSDPDKRSVTGTQGPNIPMRYPDKGTVTELGNSVDGKKGLPLRDSSLRDMPMREQSLRDAQRAEDMSRRDKQSIVSDFDRSREKPLKTKTFEHLGVDSVGMYRPSNGLTSRTAENGAMSFSHDKNFISSEARSSPYLANEPPTLVPYHNTLPPRSSISMTHSNVPSTMPKLTPIAPRMSNGSPLTVSYSSEAEHRNSPSLGTKRQNYVNTMNPVSSEPSVTSHSVTPWTANYHGKPPQGERADENWRTKQNPREERDLNRTGGYDPAQKLHLARKFHPQAWERPLYYGALPPQVRAAGGDKDFSEDVDSRDVSRDSTREGMKSSDQSQAKMASGGYKYSTVPVNLRKESDLVNTKIPASSSQDAEYQKNQPFVGRNEKSVIGEYVNYNKNDDGKGSLGNVIVHGKEGSFRISVERREGGQKSPKPKVTKPSRMEQNRAVSGSYSSNYDGREQSEGNYIGMQRGELKSTRDDKAKEGVDRARHLEPPRSREQSLYQEHTGRKPDSRELSSLNDDKKINDRNNNSTSLGAFPFYKHGAGGFPLVASGEQMRFVERGPVCDDKVSVPPNMTLDRYEKREQEIEKNAFKRTDFNAFPRNVEGSHSLNPNDECSKRNEERRGLPRRDEAKPKVTTGRFENDKRVGDAEEISSDENDDGTTRVSRETVSPEKRAQIRVPQSSDRTASSPAAGAIRQRRLSSPLSDQRGVAADKRNIGVSNAYGASFGPSLQNRRIVSDGSDGHSRESNTESGMEVLGNSGPPQFLRMDGGAAFPSPYYGQLLPTPQGLSEAPVVFLDPASFYGAMYRPHLMEAAPQGMFSPGTFSDPVTGQIMMIPPEAYIPMVAAENPFMNPMMDPRFHAMWGMPGAIDEAQWQQFYQMMQPFQQQQQKQQQQLLEQSKQEFLLGKHSAQFPMASYPFYYGDKHLEQKRKEEMQDVKSTEHQQKSREVQQESSESQAKETATRPKPEPAAQQERVQRIPASRDSEFVQQQEISNQRDDKSATDSRWMKEAHQKLVEKQKKVQAKIDAQGQMAKQIKEYLSLDAGSQFPFTGPQTSFLRDSPSVNLSVPVTSGSARTPEVDRKSVSPKTVSAAVTLSSLEKSRAQEHNSAGRLSPQTSSDARVVTSQNSVVDRVKSPRLRPWTESTSSNEIVETPRRLEAQPNLAGERLVSRESRELPTGSVPLPFPQKLMAFGNIASERLLREKAEQDSERQRFGKPFRAYDESLSLNFNEMSRGNSEKPMPGNFGDNLPKSEDSHRAQSYGEMMTSFVKSEIERAEREMQPVHTGLRESVDSQEDSRANFQALVAREKLSPPEHHESDSDYEDDFRTKCELRRLASSFVPLKPDLENKENSTIFSLRPVKSEAERKEIRDNIDRLRSMAKRRNSKDRFKVFSRRSDLRSPTTILNGVTSAVGGDVAGVESVEKEMRMKLAELQKRYREKVRELARLQPKYGVEDGNGKSTPIKRGPGRPRKRKYFGASSKGDKHSPIPTADENRDGAESLLVSSAQSPEPPSNAVASESDSLLSKESEPPKKKKRRMKHNNPVEQEVHRTATPTLGISPVEPTDVQVPTVKKKKSRKPSAVEEESAAVALSKSKPTDVKKKKAAGAGKRRKGSPTENALEQQVTAQIPTALPEICAKELETNANFMEPEIPTKNTKTKKLKPKKRARPKLTVDTPESYVGKADDESPLGRAAASGETPPSTKSKKTKGKKKKKNSTAATPSKAKFEFRDATSQDDSFSENSSVSPNEIAKEVVAMAAKQMEAQRNSRQIPSDNDDDVFTTNHDGRDGLSLLAQASFETADKSTKRKRSSENSALSEDLSQKKRGRPKKDMESSLSEPDAPVAPKKKKKKKVLEEDSTKQPKKKKKKKKKKVTTPKEESPEEKPARVQQEEQPEPPSSEQQEKIEIKQPEMSAANEDSEQDEDVFRPAAEVSKDTRPSHSTSGISREGDDMKGSISSLLSDEWQPRRSERIFINSSVTTNSSPSPLSPTGKGNEFFYGKKTKKGPGIRGKSSRSDSQVEEELAESDAIVPQKGKGKAKKKRGPVKGKKRIPSDEDYEPLKISRRARSKSRQPIDFDDEDEEEPDDLQEDQELHEEGETDVEISITDKMDTSADGSEEKGQQSESVENENIIKPEAEEEKMETEVKDDKEDVEMEVDENVEDKNDTREAIKADVVEESKEKESTEEITRSEEMTEQKEASCERASSPVDVRFTFLIEELREGTKLLVPVDSVFFPGRISTFNEPDLFGVVLDGERGRRPHWKSTEQLLTRAVKDIQPPSAKFIPIGTRVCAHWSPQYRCFYPGTVTEAPPDEKEVEGKTWIEFDDGDSGFFQLNEIKRIHPDFPVEDAENTPTMPEKSPRSSSLGPLQSKAIKDSSSRLRAEENTSEFSSGNESSGEIQAKRRRLRGKRKSKDDSWIVSKQTDNNTKESNSNKGETARSKAKENEKSGAENTGSLTKVKDKSQSSSDSQENKVSDAHAPPRQKSSKIRGKIETNVESKETTRTAENTKHDLPSNASAELKESEKEIHSSDSSLKTGDYENNAKQSSDKVRATAENNTESSDQGEDSDANSDVETSKNEKGARGGTKGSSRTSEKDLRRRSLTLNLNSSFRSLRADGESPTRDALSTSQDEDSESYSDAFDESPLVENKSFQPRLGRRRRSELDRLQVDMKFSGPLWQWSGRNFQNKRKGKGKKVFYRAIVRGDETISVGDCAVFMSNPTKNLNLPYVGKIESMWEGCGGNMVVRVKWFYHPEETKPGRKPTDGKQSLYRSTHVDENDVQTISHKCEVLTPEEFKRRFQSLESPGTRTSLSDRVFCCIGSYDPNSETLQPEL